MEFVARRDIRVVLHGEDGGRLGVAEFHNGVWVAGTPAEAEAMLRAMPGLYEFGVTTECIPPAPTGGVTLLDHTKAELVEMAEEMGVEVDARDTKSEIAAAIEAARN